VETAAAVAEFQTLSTFLIFHYHHRRQRRPVQSVLHRQTLHHHLHCQPAQQCRRQSRVRQVHRQR